MAHQASAASLVEQIEAEAYRLGFCLFGVTGADPLEDYPIYEKWLAQGLNAGMSYMASAYHRGCRRDPRLLFAQVKSILVLGWPYALTVQTGSEPRGWLAGYALEADYHERLRQPLQALVDFIHRTASEDFESRYFTDSAPVLERELGRRAGLGWIAKNSCLISPKMGSNFLLAEIFLSLELQPAQPFTADRCGKCRRCLEACPTGCIRSDRTIDAGRCISYLTIENKGGMPLELREPVGTWLFGCDVCQAVCPWNSRSLRLQHAKTRNASLELDEMLNQLALTPAEFNAAWSNSPVLRAKQAGFLRNLVTVLANTRDKRAIDALESLLSRESDPSLQELVRWALARLAG